MQRDVELLIKGRKDSSVDRSVNESTQAFRRLAAAQQATANYKGQIQSAKDAANSWRAAREEASRLGRQMAATKNPSDQLKASFQAARDASRQARQATIQHAAALMQARGASQGTFHAFIQNAEALRDEGRASIMAGNAIEALNADLPPLAAAHDRAAAAARRQAMAERELAGAGGLAGRQVGAWASRQGRGPLGLRPYELQNLGYQINDLFTQIASGTPVMQAFTQQGGQIAQIFPRATMAILRLTPVLAGLGLAVAPVIGSMRNLSDEAESLADFGGRLAASADGAEHSARAMTDAARQLDVFGGSIEDARQMVVAFNREGLDDSQLVRFGRATSDMVAVFGGELPQAAEDVARAFTGTYDQVKELDDALNFLTTEERRHIREMFESGRASEARTEAFRIFERQMDRGAQRNRSVWQPAVRNLTTVWNNWLDSVGNSAPIRAAGRFIDWLAGRIAALTQRMVAASEIAAGLEGQVDEASMVARIREINRQLVDNSGAMARLEADPDGRPASRPNMTNAQVLAQARARQQALIAEQNRLFAEQRRRYTPDINLEDIEGNAADKAAEDAALAAAERAARGGGGSSGADEAERRAEAQQDFVAGLDAENEARRFQLSLLGEQEREARILDALRDAELEAAGVGLALTEAQSAEIRETVGALYDQEQAQRVNELIERGRLQLAEERGEVESRAAFIAREAQEAGVDLLSEQGQIFAEIQGQLYDIAETERQRTEYEREVNQLLSLQRDLQDQIQFARDRGDFGVVGLLEEQLEGVNTALRAAAENAITFWAAQSGPEADAALVNFQGLIDRLDAMGTQVIATADQINEMLTDGLVSGFDDFFSGLEQGKTALESMRDAFLSFAADFLRQIARMILQQAILNALQSFGGGGGGGVGGTVSGWLSKIPVRHAGGLADSGGPGRPALASWFSGAMRFHNGGIPGLKPNEVPTILERNEEVLTRGDPRHVLNGGKGGGKDAGTTVVNVFDPNDFLDRALASDVGRKLMLNFVSSNPGAIKAAIG
jgi:hypothetical protein